ncbi:GP46-like surface antigen, putative [Bodo saltans]|uniref:GP46-like surface antigen, putative n=1 Tax=Bodo saltans TaxID=75058 RepID=A0A0S4ISN8_BODSA|nr:GP46-like surface antigen, putative [Bodo saltans]|eukprot:CUE72550.1 GP46-like surface antigen, putative [Bodo saltans]
MKLCLRNVSMFPFFFHVGEGFRRELQFRCAPSRTIVTRSPQTTRQSRFLFLVLMAALTVALLLSLNVILVSNACDCQSYRAPLLALYDSAGGPHWRNAWDLNLEVCDWFGVNCKLFGIYMINLTQQQLTGTLPGASFTDSIGGLERLILSSNNLTGTIPPQYGNITSLWKLEQRYVIHSASQFSYRHATTIVRQFYSAEAH